MEVDGVCKRHMQYNSDRDRRWSVTEEQSEGGSDGDAVSQIKLPVLLWRQEQLHMPPHPRSSNKSRNCKLRWKLNKKEDCLIHAPGVFMRSVRARLGQTVKRTPTQVHQRTTIHWTNAQKPLPDGSLSCMILSQPFCTVDPHIPCYVL